MPEAVKAAPGGAYVIQVEALAEVLDGSQSGAEAIEVLSPFRDNATDDRLLPLLLRLK